MTKILKIHDMKTNEKQGNSYWSQSTLGVDCKRQDASRRSYTKHRGMRKILTSAMAEKHYCHE